ncbi:MAG: glycosyltransferase family 39 protein [Solirubrobacterales bacterium]|nr:glycosyltransferase family 39 protein [Solirubrobacterales bacterium]
MAGPSGERSPALAKLRGAWPVALLIVAVAAAYAVGGLGVNTYQYDESLYLGLARWLPGDLPGSLWDLATYQRGTERLEVFLLAPIFAWLPTPEAFKVARILNAVAFTTAAIPAYLIARGLGASRNWAWVGSALAVIMPGAIVTTALLTEGIAYPAAAWAIWAIWRSTAEPSWRRDLAAVALIGVAMLARTGFVLIVGVWLLAAVVQSARFRVAGVRGGAVAATASTLWRQRRIAALGFFAVAVAILAEILLGVGSSVLGYKVSAADLVGRLVNNTPKAIVLIIAGTGLVPAIVAMPWLVSSLRRGGGPARHAFALITFGMVALAIVSVTLAGLNERYLIYVVPLIAVACVVALGQRAVSPIGVVAASALVALLLFTTEFDTGRSSVHFFSDPAEVVWAWLRFGGHTDYLGGVRPKVLVATLVVVGGLVALAVSSRAPTWAPILVVGAVLVWQGVGTEFVFEQNVVKAQLHDSPESQSWVDQAVGHDAVVALTRFGSGSTIDSYQAFRDVAFFNSSVKFAISVDGAKIHALIARPLVDAQLDERTGVLVPPGLPHLIVILRDRRLVWRGRVVARASNNRIGYRSRYLESGRPAAFQAQNAPMVLIDTGGQPALEAVVRGPRINGMFPPSSKIGVRAWARKPGRCAILTVLTVASTSAPLGYRVTVDGRVRAGLLQKHADSIYLAIPFQAGSSLDATVAIDRSPLAPDDGAYGLRLAGVRVGSCNAAG